MTRLSHILQIAYLLCILHHVSSQIVPTLWGVEECTYAIDFNLKDINPKSDRYGEEYGLYYSEKTDIIIVGLYMADAADSPQNAKRQQELGQELIDMGYTVKNVAINYYAPWGCVMEGECVSFWWNNPFMFPGSDNCAGYVAGCNPQDERLTYAKWQASLSDAIDLPVFQDFSPGWAWDEFGGLQVLFFTFLYTPCDDAHDRHFDVMTSTMIL